MCLSAVALAHTPVLHSRTKHMELELFFVGEKVVNKLIHVFHVPVIEQCGDILIEGLSPSRFCTSCFKLEVVD